MPLYTMTFSVSIRIFCVMTISIMAYSVMTLSIVTFSIMDPVRASLLKRKAQYSIFRSAVLY